MRSLLFLLAVVLACVSVSHAKDLIVGTSFNNRLLHQVKEEYNAIPLKKRVKEFFFSDPGQQVIKVSLKYVISAKNCEASQSCRAIGAFNLKWK